MAACEICRRGCHPAMVIEYVLERPGRPDIEIDMCWSCYHAHDHDTLDMAAVIIWKARRAGESPAAWKREGF